ncbi:hypothetical protein [Loigolactobacillus rennini]|uniref:Alanine acetyl transferase (YoaA protein) n=2 Tax=Loigolactobacillus rennini TaxID=238013 RepID=A0A0R2D2N3_9LACO|nr:hypothetical protein [Loigolactobacillus rennini]KRM98430.1 alanine acetyl transferase (YoaA protein) [Loigolactobacillus rennini DSM 20253]SFZ88345.1 Acetyltransferases, including N-acetylases of ribosomal proteins [Loigolactobacillus rennini]
MKFELYHPMMSTNYTLDWLTQTPLKQIKAALPSQSSMTATAQQINQAMQLIMHNQALIWGITHRQTKTFCGIVRLDISPDQQATLKFSYRQQTLTLAAQLEIIAYLAAFTFKQLKLQRFVVNTANSAVGLRRQLLTQNYSPSKEKIYLIKNK